MKLILTLAILLMTTIMSFGQSFEWLTTDSIVVKLEKETYVELKMEQTNLTSDTLKLAIEIIEKNIPSSWDGMVCVEGTCLGLIPEVGVVEEMYPVYGEQTGFVRLTINPMKGEEFGSLRIRVFNLDNPSDDDTATWLLNDKSLSIKDYSLLNTINIYPNPVAQSFHINSHIQMDRVSLMDINGRNVYNTTFNSFTDFKIDVSAVPAGIYFVHTYFQETMNGIKKVVIE